MNQAILWEQARNTRNPESAENRLEDGVTVKQGLFRMLKIEWDAVGADEDSNHYELSGTEYDPISISATWFGAKPSMQVRLSAHGEAQHRRVPTEKSYLIHLVDGELVDARGSLSTPDQRYPLAYEQAAVGFQSALEAVRFEPVEKPLELV